MRESQRVVQQLIEEVVALSEATREFALAEDDPFTALEAVRTRHAAIKQSIAQLEAVSQDEVEIEGAEPRAPLPNNEIVESLDDLFGVMECDHPPTTFPNA